MSTNPFENNDALYHVLINSEEQHSLWPTFKEVPAGWTIVLESAPREEALKYVQKNWTDMRPKSIRWIIHSFAASDEC